MNKLKFALLVGSLVFSTSAMAEDKTLTDRWGNFITDRQGDCVQTRGGTEGCGVTVKQLSFETNTFFDFDKADLKPAGKAKLDEIVDELKRVQTKGIAVVGHTDSTGPAAYNQGLSERRAKSVADYLVAQGVDANAIRSEGRGELEPVVPNDTRENRAKNRRVDILIDVKKEVINK